MAVYSTVLRRGTGDTVEEPSWLPIDGQIACRRETWQPSTGMRPFSGKMQFRHKEHDSAALRMNCVHDKADLRRNAQLAAGQLAEAEPLW